MKFLYQLFLSGTLITVQGNPASDLFIFSLRHLDIEFFATRLKHGVHGFAKISDKEGDGVMYTECRIYPERLP